MRANSPDRELLLVHDHLDLKELLVRVVAALKGVDAVAAFDLLDRFWARLAMHIRAEHLRTENSKESIVIEAFSA